MLTGAPVAAGNGCNLIFLYVTLIWHAAAGPERAGHQEHHRQRLSLLQRTNPDLDPPFSDRPHAVRSSPLWTA